MALSQIVQRVAAAGQRLRVRSALNPILWLCSTVSVPVFFLAAYSDAAPRWMQVVFIAIGTLPIVAAVLGFGYFVLTNPRRLQSEDYQISERLLDFMMQEKGNQLEDAQLTERIQNPKTTGVVNKSEEDQ